MAPSRCRRHELRVLDLEQRRDLCGLQHGGTVDQKKQYEARHLRRLVTLFSEPVRQAELFAMRACCNSCNQATEALGLTRDVLAYYRQKILLERALAAAQQREEAAAAAVAAAAAAADAAPWHRALWVRMRAGPRQPCTVS